MVQGAGENDRSQFLQKGDVVDRTDCERCFGESEGVLGGLFAPVRAVIYKARRARQINFGRTADPDNSHRLDSSILLDTTTG